MVEKKLYTLPDLPYDYAALEPYISEEIMRLHHDKHHKAYVDNANKIIEMHEQAHADNQEIDLTAALKALSFNVGGHVLHSLFWKNMAPVDKGGEPEGKLKEVLEKGFGSIEKFKQEFSKTAIGVEGSGWAALAYCKMTDRLLLMQIEKHNANIYPTFKLLMVLDVWEHAYYLDYQNERAKYVEGFWNIVDWEEVEKRMVG